MFPVLPTINKLLLWILDDKISVWLSAGSIWFCIITWTTLHHCTMMAKPFQRVFKDPEHQGRCEKRVYRTWRRRMIKAVKNRKKRNERTTENHKEEKKQSMVRKKNKKVIQKMFRKALGVFFWKGHKIFTSLIYE